MIRFLLSLIRPCHHVEMIRERIGGKYYVTCSACGYRTVLFQVLQPTVKP